MEPRYEPSPIASRKVQAFSLLAPKFFPLLVIAGWMARHYLGVFAAGSSADLSPTLLFLVIPTLAGFVVGSALAVASLVIPQYVKASVVSSGYLLALVAGMLTYHVPEL